MKNTETWYEQVSKPHPELIPIIDPERVNSIQSIVLMRIPPTVTVSDATRVFDALWQRNSMPVAWSLPSMTTVLQPMNSWPTDEIRSIAGRVLVRDAHLYNNLLNMLESYGSTYSTFTEIASSVKRNLLVPGYTGFGHDCLILDPLQKAVFAYHRDKSTDQFGDQMQKRKEFEVWLQQNGYQVSRVDISGISYSEGMVNEDLDFLFHPFMGIDGLPHALVAESFAPRAPQDFYMHIIPDDQAARGGCNVADCNSGTLLLMPNRVDAPDTVSILSQTAAADLIELPGNYYADGGGPRCLNSSIPVASY